MEKYYIKIAEDFSPTLGGRWIKIGPFSGELFYETILKEKYEEAIKNGAKLNIYLDGTKGYGSSFLDQSFGELYRKHDSKEVINTLVFHTQYFESIVEYIKTSIWK
jgi:hypothetical protein